MKNWRQYQVQLMELWKKKGSTILVAAGLCGIAMLGLSAMIPTKKDSAAPSADTQQDSFAYGQALESELEALLMQVEGVGRCSVMVTTQTGVENVYAIEQSQSSNENDRYEQEVLSQQSRQSDVAERYILVDAGSGRKEALVKTQRMPTVQGVVVVCDGGGNPVVRERVLSVVAAATGAAYHRVHVTERARGASP